MKTAREFLKSTRGYWVAVAGLAVIGSAWAAWAQLQSGGGQTAGEVIEAARAQAALEPVEEKTIPLFTFEPSSPPGTYWMLQSDSPPWPFDPFPELVIYALGGDGWLVDDRSVDWPGLQAQIVESLQAVGLLGGADAVGAGAATMNSGVPVPPGDGGGEGEGGGSTNGPTTDGWSSLQDAPTNALWISIGAVTNGWAYLALHGTEPDSVYEVLSKVALTNGAWISEGTVLGAPGTNYTPTSVAVGARTNTLFFWARSWMDSDGSGLPDWWQLQYFGHLGVDPYGDPDGDGWNNLDEYQNGANPTVFNAPRAPQPFTALVASATANDVHLTWGKAPGSVVNYLIERRQYAWESFTNLATVSASATDLTDLDAFPHGPLLFVPPENTYRIRAVYTGGATSLPNYASASLGQDRLKVNATLTRKTDGRWVLVVGHLPHGLSALELTWLEWDFWVDLAVSIATVETISATNVVGGVYVLPDATVVAHLMHRLSVRGVYADGTASGAMDAGFVSEDAPYFVDGRQHLLENLKFRLRAASQTQSYLDGYYGLYPWGADFEESGFMCPAREAGGLPRDFVALNNLWPFDVNQWLRGALYNPVHTNEFDWQTNFVTIPVSAVLSQSDPYWILQSPDRLSQLGATLSANQHSVSLASSFTNKFGLTAGAAFCLTGPDPITGFPCGGSGAQQLALGGSVSFGDCTLGSYYSQFTNPVLSLVNYYFAPVITPGDHQSGTGVSLDGQPYRLPLQSNFAVTNQTPLLITSLGSKTVIGGWAKYSILNGYAGKYAYLGQYFESALKIATNGVITTNQTGILSPYGEFFPTEPGPTALATMPDLDTGARGTAIVNVVKLQTDVDHNGIMDLSFGGPDNTSQARPMLFWVNDDFDRLHDVDCTFGFGCDSEEDDLKAAGSPGTVGITPDCDYQWASGAYAIPSKRDLEDYTRLWIPGIKKLYEAHTNLIFELSVRNNDQTDGPAINLFLAVESDGGTRYLTDTSVANEQISLPSGKFVGRIRPNSTVRLNDFFNLALYPGTGAENFIWCGARRGKGELVLQVKNGTNLLAETSLWLDLKNIKEIYERWTVGDIGSMEPFVRATNAVDDLPKFVAPFRYDAPTDTNTPYILHVHGWNMERWEKDRFAETMYKRLYWQGYQGRFGEFRWPTRSGFDMVSWQNPATTPNHFDRSEFNAWKSALGLGWLLIDLKNKYPGHVYLTAHSMGNIVAGEALRITNTNAALVKTYVAIQAAVASHAYDGNAPTRTINSLRDDGTPNRYAHYYQSNSPPYFNGVVGAANYINFYNTNDYALAAIRWQLDQDFKPAGTIGYGYIPDNGKFYKEYYGTELVFPTDTYEIFSFCDEARCYALGAQANVGGSFQTANQVDLGAAPFNFGTAHKGHSAQFRSTNMERAAFWNRFLIRAGLKEE